MWNEKRKERELAKFAKEIVDAGHEDDARDFLVGDHEIGNLPWDGGDNGLTSEDLEAAVVEACLERFPELTPEGADTGADALFKLAMLRQGVEWIALRNEPGRLDYISATPAVVLLAELAGVDPMVVADRVISYRKEKLAGRNPPKMHIYTIRKPKRDGHHWLYLDGVKTKYYINQGEYVGGMDGNNFLGRWYVQNEDNDYIRFEGCGYRTLRSITDAFNSGEYYEDA